MDETMLRLFPGALKGAVSLPEGETTNTLGEKKRMGVSRKQLRGCFSHVAFICDDSALQPLLPQFLIGSKSLLLQREIDVSIDVLPDNVYLFRQASAWVTHETMVILLRLVFAELAKHAPERETILLMDTSQVHLHSAVLRTCRRHNVRIAWVPAGLTWLLQPLDTHVFARYKRFLRRRYAEHQASSKDGKVDTVAFFSIVSQGIREIFNSHKWRYAFDATGFGRQQRRLGERVRRMASHLGISHDTGSMSKDAMLKEILPKGRSISDALSVGKVPCAPAVVVKRMRPHAEAHLEPDKPWPLRLRSAAAMGRVDGSSFVESGHPSAASSSQGAEVGVAKAEPCHPPHRPRAMPLFKAPARSAKAESLGETLTSGQ